VQGIRPSEERPPIRWIPLLLAFAALTGCGRPSVLHVGLDGATFDVIVPLVEAGYLPHVGALMEEGAWGDLDCVPALPSFPCFCPPVWTSIATGQPYDEHAVLSLESRSSERRAPAIWNVLHAAGRASVSISYRATYPPASPLGVVVSEGQLDRTAEDVYAPWPAAKRLPGYDAPSPLFPLLGLTPHDGERLPAISPMARDRLAVDLLLAIEASLWHSPALTNLLLHSLDKSSHVAWSGIQQVSGGPYDEERILHLAELAIERGPVFGPAPWSWGTAISQYVELDDLLGRVLEASDYDYVVITSDHGMDRNPEPGLTGSHDRRQPAAWDGIFIAAGPGIRPGTLVEGATVLDVAPTLAYLLRLPVSRELPGVVLDIFEERWEARRPIRWVDSWHDLAPSRRLQWLPAWLLKLRADEASRSVLAGRRER